VDFRSNGANRVKPASINNPYKVVVDYSQTPYALYVSDLSNHRVLGWRDSVRFRTGDPADLVIGQPDFDSAVPNVDSRNAAIPTATSLSAPRGLALDWDGNLYVADSGNHRVLRYPRPVAQTGRITPDLVLGQVDFTTAVSAAVSASSLNSPAGLALDPDGNLFVADSSNHRVLQFPQGSVNGAAAIRVFGQPGFNTGVPPSAPSVQTLSAPQGLYVDASYTLFVADTGASRVLVFPNTRDAAQSGAAAAIVLGQNGFDTAVAGAGVRGLRLPFDVALDSSGKICVSDTGNNRVVVFPSLLFLPLAGAEASEVLGQRDLSGTSPNWNAPADGLTTAESLSSPLGVFVDRRDTVYVGDAGNNRVVHFLKPSVITHAANAQVGAPLARGGLANFSGANLVDGTVRAEGSPLPMEMQGREIVIDDEIRAPLASSSPEKIEFQVPANTVAGPSRVALRLSETGELVAGGVVPVAATSPGLFVNDEAARGHGRIQNQDGSTNTPSAAALRGATIKIFGTGQGPVSPPLADGTAAAAEGEVSTVAVPTSDGNTCLSRQPSVCVAIGNTFGEVQFSGLAPNQVGVWQLTVRLPLNAPTGNAIPLRAVINGSPSNIVMVAIR
jgi:uncharacterized protein (TIGR03437 family)